MASKWDSILKPAAGIAGDLLKGYASSGDAEATYSGELVSSTFVGDVEWGQESTGNYVAINRGDVETTLIFSKTPSDGEPQSTAFTLGTKDFVDVSETLKSYNSGDICVGKTEVTSESSDAGAGQKLISAGFSYLALKTVARITENLSITYYKNADGGSYFTLGSTAPPEQTWTATVKTTDGQNGTVGVTAELTKENSTGGTSDADDWQWTINLPAGIDLDPLINKSEVTIEVEEGEFETLLAGSRRLVRRYPG